MGKEIILGDRVLQSIQWIRGQTVLLDSDPAELCGVDTNVLNYAVKRNRVRACA